MKVLALRERFAHMSAVSGYDALYSHFPQDIEVNSIYCDFKKMYPRGIGRILQNTAKLASASGFYNAQSVEAEARLMVQTIKKSPDIVHYSYGEPYFGFAGLLKNIFRGPVVVTNHQPVSWWQQHERFSTKYRKADRVICLTEFDRDYFNTLFPKKAICIPHGVDVDFFKPGSIDENERRTFNAVFVGRYLRDTGTLVKMIKKMSQSEINIRFDIVYSDKSEVTGTPLNDIKDLAVVNWHTDISEAELLLLYQAADCCVIPLLDCTANNAILESLACGLPVIATDLPSVRTYLDKSAAILTRKGNPDDLCQAIELLYTDKKLRIDMGVHARQMAAEKFDWNVIAAQTAQLFLNLL
ncbi:MAG: hypothetical protein JWR09_955 [Mucilaginibacter sp.]|nr:hypothetical protein [Mucilaginibacter sp.]